jgi:hypothetical protein
VFRGYLCFLWIKPLRTCSLFAESNVALDQGSMQLKTAKGSTRGLPLLHTAIRFTSSS